ncbi:MAG: hypothetical protein Q9195_009194 [Heterodermia aff. obscurata]
MNPGGFPNMGMQSVGPQSMPQQGGLQRAPNPAQAAQARIYQLIQLNQQQYLPQGWQTTLPTQQRVANIRLIKNDMTVDKAIQVASSFEQKTFQESPDKTRYDQTCRSKMEDIARTREQLAKSMQQQLQNGHHVQMNMSQQPMQMQGFPNLNQQQLQMQQQQQQQQQQQHMAQRLMQQQQQQQQQQQNQIQGMVVPPQAQMPMGNPQARMPRMPANMPQPMPTQQQPKYTPQEQQEITRKSQEFLTSASQNQDQMNRIRHALQQNNPNMDLDHLVRVHFQTQAIKWFENLKQMSAARAGQLIPGPNGAPVAQQGRPIPQDPSRIPNQQPTPVSASQSFDPSFMGSVDQMRLSALRDQEAGQVVVPESQPPRTMGGGTQANTQNVVNRPVQTPQIPQQPPQLWNQQNGQPPQQTNVYPNNMNGVPSLQGQQGGLSNVARTPQQNANMPNLNRAFGPQSTQPGMQPQQSTPQMGQRTPANAQQVMQNGLPRLPTGMTQAQFQQRLQQMPEADRKALLVRMQAAQKEQQQSNQGVPMQPQRSQQGQPMPVNPQPAPRTAQANPPPQQPVSGQNQAQPPPNQPQRNGLQVREAALAANRSLTNEQEQQMDNYPYPPGILNTGNALSQLPSGIKTWGQLKKWVKINSNTLPPGSEHKLRGLQGLHYQNLQQPKKGLPTPAMRNAAPPASMTPRPNQGPANLPIPQPTPQEIINLRGKHPQLASLTDDQIRGMVMQQRAQEMMRRRGMMMHPRQVPQNPTQTPVGPVGQPQQPPSSAQRPQPQQTPKPVAQPKSQAGTTPQVPAPSPGPQKGIKRPSSDDVVEVPNPNINQQKSQTKAQPKAPHANMVQVPQKPAEAQRAQFMQREKSNAQPPQMVTQTPPKTAEASKSEDRYRTIIGEVRQSTPQRQPVPMDPDTRRKMLEKLASSRELITRMGVFLPVFFKVFNDEDALRTAARVYLTLAQQYRNEQVKLASPVEHFTIGLDELEANLNTVKGYFALTMDRINRQKGGAVKAAEPAKDPTMPAELNKANLQKHQDDMKRQREQMKKESNRPPPAPITTHPPQLGPSPPANGAPIYPPTNNFSGKLNIPPAKRVKPDHLVPKSPTPQKTPAPVMLKCPVSNCSETKGFASQVDLDKHMVEHETREPNIEDPFKFALEQMQLALNLDKHGRSKPKVGASLSEAPKMEKSSSLQGIQRDPATPMSRVPTGPSPASHLKTPQPAKTPAPSSNALPDVILPEDPWADSLVRPEAIQEAFSPLSTLTGPKTWTRIQDYLTPESSSSDSTDPSKSSPRLSDVSENDAVKISLDTSSLSKNWVPISWTDPELRHVDDFELLDLNVDHPAPDQMDWETMFDETDEEAQARVDKERIRVERDLARGGTGVTDEFAKIYGYGEMEPRMGRR